MSQIVSIFTGEITNWQQINTNYPNQAINRILNAGFDVASVFLNSILNPPVTFVAGYNNEHNELIKVLIIKIKDTTGDNSKCE